MADNRWRDSAYGRVIHEDVVLEDMPQDTALLIRSANAYWDYVVQGTYEDNLTGSRVRSAFICEKIWQIGKSDQYPEAPARLAYLKYCMEDYAAARPYMEHWLEHICLTADICTLSREFLFYLDELSGSYQKVFGWCRKRAEQDRLRRNAPIGMILLRHFLIMQCMIKERRVGENVDDFWERMYRMHRLVPIVEHQLIAQRWDRTSLVWMFSNKEPRPPKNWELRETRQRANNGSLIALAHVLNKEWTWDTPETISGWQKKWDEGCLEIQQEEASFGSDWFEKEKENALETGKEIREKGAIRLEGRGLYMEGLARYAMQDTNGAIELMRLACDKLSYEAMGWLSRHDIDYLDKNFVEPYSDMMEMETLADQLHTTPDASGMKKLAKVLEQGGELYPPLPKSATLLYTALKPLRAEAEVLDQVMACGRKEALALADQMLESIEERPELADKLRWYSLLVRMHIAKLDGTLLIQEPIDFIAIDLDDAQEDLQLMTGTEDDWDALYKLCVRYAQDTRVGNNPYLASVSYHLGRRICEFYRDIYFRIEDESTRQGVLQDWLRISQLMDRGDGGAEAMRIGLYQEYPYFCSLLKNKEIVSTLGLTDSQVIEYLQVAQANGYDVAQELESRIGTQKDVYTTDYFETRCQKRLEEREQARDWMADTERLLTEGAASPVLDPALLEMGEVREGAAQPVFRTLEWGN